MKYTLLSKWTALGLSLATAGMTLGGIKLLGSNAPLSILLFVLAVPVYVIAWFVALFDAFQEKRFGWVLGLIVLLPTFVGPAIYGVLGPKNTK